MAPRTSDDLRQDEPDQKISAAPQTSDQVSAPNSDAGANIHASEETVGTVLRRARMARGGKPVSEIADEIRVRPHQLEALEADEYDKLPGLIYAAGFIRAYAAYLELDGDDLVDRFKRTARTEDLEAHLAFPEPMEDPRIPRRSLVAVACVMGLAVYGAWYGLSSHGETGFEEVPTVESRLAGVLENSGANVAPTSEPVAAAEPAQASVPGREDNGASGVGDTGMTGLAEVPTPQKAPEDAIAAAVAEVQGDVAPEDSSAEDMAAGEVPAVAAVPSNALLQNASTSADTASQRISVRARQDAWVRVQGPADETVIDKVLKAGEVYEAPAGRGLYMMTGNAGALDILVDGRSIGTLGPQGQIRRHVSLDASLLNAPLDDPARSGGTPPVRQQ